METQEITELKARVLAWNEKAKINGRLFTKWTCPHCSKELETPKPKRSEVNARGCWDGAKVCYECGETSLVKTYPNGKTEAININDFKND